MRLGIFGGTFNPPHMGHVEAAAACVQALRLDALWLMPTGIPPHKALPEGSASASQRLDMARLAAQAIPRGAACGLELERQGASYTVDTLREIRAQRPEDALWLVIGSDMLLSFERWREYREIAKMVRLAVVSREAGDRPALEEKAAWLTLDCGAEIDFVDNAVNKVSSTAARAGEADALPPGVPEYVVRNLLYSDDARLAALRQMARERLSPRRLAHVLGTEACAAAMALRFGERELDARTAALLHDITKEVPIERQLQMCAARGIMPDYPETSLDALLHADTAAILAEDELRQPEHICDAIRYHSTGRSHMSRLEKIIYVADKIEQTRQYADVPPIRALAEQNLDAATVAVLRGALAALERQGRPPYGRTQDALTHMIDNK